jgi:hypothetical protein
MPMVIKSSKIMAVEGKDEEKFFKCLLKFMEIEEFEIFDVGGVSQFKDKLPALVRATGFSEIVTKLVIVRDADKSAENAFKSVKNILLKENINPPDKPNQFSQGIPQVGVFIMPGDSEEGMLEDLCMRTVKNSPTTRCVEGFIDCARKLEKAPRNIAKSKAQAFLAAMPEIVNSVGLGAEKDYWDFNSDELNDLKLFLRGFA